MTGEDLKEILLAGADGCVLAQKPIVVPSCDLAIRVLDLFNKGENINQQQVRAMANEESSLDLLISMLSTTMDWNLKGNWDVQAQAMRGFSENWRILRFVAKRINRNERV